MNLPELTEALDEIEFFEHERTDRQVVELAILLYNFGVSFRKVARVLGWIGVNCQMSQCGTGSRSLESA